MIDCPHCGAEDALEVLVDALAVYAFTGFDKAGKIDREGHQLRVDEFDDIHVQCQQCGEKVVWTA